MWSKRAYDSLARANNPELFEACTPDVHAVRSCSVSGRISTLTREVQEAICESLRNGSTLKCAAQKAGVGETTVMTWRARGRNGESPYKEFWEATKEAEAVIESEMANAIVKAGKNGAWQAALAWNERRRSKDWWLLRPGHGEAKDPSKMSDEELRASLIRALERLDAKAKEPK